MAYHWTIHVTAPPEAVFDALADVAHHGEWANSSAKLRVSAVSDGPPRVGARYRSEQVFVGRPQTADIEIVEFDRPRRFAFRVAQRKQGGSKETNYTHRFVLSPEEGGTRLERTTDGDGNRLIGFLAAPAIKADGNRSLGNLKAMVEEAAR
jgi:uncharacterized protein YndB with AHSA1/START domain